MLGKFVKVLEWIGHGSTATQILGWVGIPTTGFVGFAVTFFSSAVEGWSVTAVWIASVATGTLLAVLYAALMIGLAYRRSKVDDGGGIEAKTGTRVSIAAELIRAPQYNRAQIDLLVEAIDAFYPIVLDLDRELESGVGIAQSMESLVLHNGPKHYLEQMDALRLNLNDALGRLQLVKEQHGLYEEVCNIVASSNNFSNPFYAAWNEVAGILRDMPDNLNARSVSIFVSGKKETFISLVSEFHQWAKQKKLELIERRKFYLRHHAMDVRREPQQYEPVPSGTVPWLDFDKWDGRKEYRLFEVACLWEDQEPLLPLTETAKRRFKTLEQAIWDKQLKIRSGGVRGSIANAKIISRGGEAKANPNWAIEKDALLLYAFGTDEKPRFLFPEQRV
jgi:hypothetical protein